jgi:hypothetical protein
MDAFSKYYLYPLIVGTGLSALTNSLIGGFIGMGLGGAFAWYAVRREQRERFFGGMKIYQVCYNGIRYAFSRGLEIEKKIEADFWVIECPELDIAGHGDSGEEVKKDFDAQFHATYQAYHDKSDDELTKDAQVLRDHLNVLVKSVTAR